MHILTILSALSLGTMLGICYGLSFHWTKALSFSDKKTTTFAYGGIVSFLRIILCAIILFYVLRIPSIPIILVLVPFFISMWVIIIKYKALHG